ncbi:hypothetical protein CDL15_Pgr008527 [Punica granatum]|uniref:Uncharacterized protein n=1 Tax=Punica granatum TaxID=22663 RepID=A0A218WMZ9_PUNGR|nr:hypothetical protein CDL15_Pgr008527 [Punica granatum]PKH64892.1 hypothetical protein CRG98_050179 [Punica granatum]
MPQIIEEPAIEEPTIEEPIDVKKSAESTLEEETATNGSGIGFKDDRRVHHQYLRPHLKVAGEMNQPSRVHLRQQDRYT